MNYLTLEKFKSRAVSGYWKNALYRWDYMSYVIDEAKRLNAKTILEAGTSGMPLCDDSILADLPFFDLNITPYDYPNKHFDIFIALQVWEHLDRQAAAFSEVARIAKSAVLSFPYLWPVGKGHDKRHEMIDDEKIAKWTNHAKPERKKLINCRMVITWKF